MSDAELVLGVDGGTTKTIALIARRDGQIVGYARGPGSNIYEAEAEECLEAIGATVSAAAAMAGVMPVDLAAAGLSLAGADTGEDIRLLAEAAAQRTLGRRRRVVNDAIGALYAACPTGAAAVAVCGTGFATSARSGSGRVWFGGHWNDWATSHGRGVLGGRAMAEAAVRAVVDEDLGLGPATELTPRLLRSFDVDDVDCLIQIVTRRGVRHRFLRTDVTAELLHAANLSDPVAQTIVTDYGAAMGDLGAAAVSRVAAAQEPIRLALMGSVLRAPCPPLREALLGSFRRRVASFEVVAPSLQPAHGAVMLALEQLGDALTPATSAELGRSSPPSELFDTAAGDHAQIDLTATAAFSRSDGDGDVSDC